MDGLVIIIRMRLTMQIALTEVVDRQIGQILEALKETGLNENTLVVLNAGRN